MMEEVGCEREVAGERLLAILFWRERYEVYAEELVGVREIIRREQYRCLYAWSEAKRVSRGRRLPSDL